MSVDDHRSARDGRDWAVYLLPEYLGDNDSNPQQSAGMPPARLAQSPGHEEPVQNAGQSDIPGNPRVQEQQAQTHPQAARKSQRQPCARAQPIRKARPPHHESSGVERNVTPTEVHQMTGGQTPHLPTCQALAIIAQEQDSLMTGELQTHQTKN